MIDFAEKSKEILRELSSEHDETYEILEQSTFADDLTTLIIVAQRTAYHAAIKDSIVELSKYEGTDFASKLLYGFAHRFLRDNGKIT